LNVFCAFSFFFLFFQFFFLLRFLFFFSFLFFSSQQDNVFRACKVAHAALEIRRLSSQWAYDAGDGNLVNITVRMGIACGPVAAGT
jgi:hypothetical protein